MRAPRDLLRRRNPRMPTRAEWSAPIQHTSSQDHLGPPLGRLATPQNRRGRLARCDRRGVQKTMAVDLALVDGDAPLRADWERSSEQTAQGHDPVSLARWRTIPGVGNILALVMRYAIEAIARFPRGQACVSYCRLVKRARASNGKRPGPSGKKIGNAHRTWAFSEAAVLFLKKNAPAQTYLAKLATRHSQGKALSILAHTRGRAVDFMLKNQVAFDQAKFLAT
jgi:transposase